MENKLVELQSGMPDLIDTVENKNKQSKDASQ